MFEDFEVERKEFFSRAKNIIRWGEDLKKTKGNYITKNVDLLSLIDVDAKVVDAGCGGARFKKYFKNMIAFDFSKDAVGLANSWYTSQTNLSFEVGNAEDLPLEDNSKDIIYNVESSHCYGNVEAFVKEVYRSLRNGGNFCWTDFRDKETMEKLHAIFLDAGFEIVSKKDVTKEVLDALDDINDSKVKGISESVPMGMRKSFETFAGVQGTPVYEAFKAGSLYYHRYLMVKT